MNLRQATTGAGQQDARTALRNQRGIALLTVMLMLLILTILGIASITVTSMENRMAGFFRSTEAVVAAADSCEGLAVNIIQQTLSPPGVLPAAFIAPTGPVPTANATTLYAEIYAFDLPAPAPAGTIAVNFADSASVAPNFVMTNLPGFTVNGDIDLLYTHPKSAQGNGTPATEHVYRITCMASNPATGSNSTVTSVYGCLDGDTCVKKIN
jgi:type IV pilus assembly protein PilX